MLCPKPRRNPATSSHPAPPHTQHHNHHHIHPTPPCQVPMGWRRARHDRTAAGGDIRAVRRTGGTATAATAAAASGGGPRASAAGHGLSAQRAGSWLTPLCS